MLGAEEEIAIIDAATNAITYMSLGSVETDGCLDVEGEFLYANGRWNGNVYKINMNDMSVVAETNIGWDMKGVALDSDGEVVYTIAPAYNEEGAILIFTESDLTFLGSITAGNYRHIVTP
ncbi:MAG: hypothetical protein U5K00_16195 [Melioribacteraceae bacterium]|nr:hypothetical protein [Melioribacteraceae bacterium]